MKTLLEESRLTTLVGSGGVGKSRLALQVGADLLDRYPEGVWLVELAPLADPLLVPQAVAQALSLREAGGRPLVQVLADRLRPRRLLLLLDNCEHLLSACASLADTLLKSCPHVRILASSREALGVAGEQSYPVPSLSLPKPGSEREAEAVERSEAMHPFVERARLYQPSFILDRLNAPLVASICRRLDGIPLAIELAAAWVRSLSVAELNARLDSGFRLLTGGSRTALPRHQTLRAAIDWSHRLLNPEEQRLLQRLSVFRGGWTLEAAEAVGESADIEEWEVLQLLTSLADKSLVLCDTSAGAERYRLLETVRQFAREKLVEAGEPEDVWQRHRDHYLSLAEEAATHLYGAEQVAWQQRLEREHDNLRAALEWSLSAEDQAEAALRLVGALSWFWLMGSHLGEGREWATRALYRGRNAPPLVLARALDCGHLCAQMQGDYTAAAVLVAEALQFARQAGDRWQIGWALFCVAISAVYRGDLEAAQASTEEGMALAQAAGDRWLIGRYQVSLGLIAWRRSDYAAARAFLLKTLEISRELADEWHIAMMLATLGFVTRGDGDDAGARALHLEGLPLIQRLGDRRGIGWHLIGMAGVEVKQGRAERAAHLLGAAAATLEANCSPLPPYVQMEHDHTLKQTEAALGAGAFAAAWAAGRATTQEQAVAFALDVGDRS